MASRFPKQPQKHIYRFWDFICVLYKRFYSICCRRQMKRPGWKDVWKRKGCHNDSPMLRCRWAHWILNNTKDVLTHFGLILLISLLTTVWSRFQTVKHYPMTTLSYNAPVANIYGVCLLDCNYSSDDNRSFIYMKEYQMKTFDIISLFGLTTHIWWLRDMETQYGPFVKSTGHRWIPSQKTPCDMEVWCFFVKALDKLSSWRWFESPWRSYDVTPCIQSSTKKVIVAWKRTQQTHYAIMTSLLRQDDVILT